MCDVNLLTSIFMSILGRWLRSNNPGDAGQPDSRKPVDNQPLSPVHGPEPFFRMYDNSGQRAETEQSVLRAKISKVLLDKAELTPEEEEATLDKLQIRFEAEENSRLTALKWEQVRDALLRDKGALLSVYKMEELGHEPTVYYADGEGFDVGTLSKETPLSTRGCVFNDVASNELFSSAQDVPSAVGQARDIGVQLMDCMDGERMRWTIARPDLRNFRERGACWSRSEFGYGGDRSRARIVKLRDGHFLDNNTWITSHSADLGWRGTVRVNYKTSD